MAAVQQSLALMEPPDPWFYVRAGDIYEWAGETEKALTAYQYAVTLDSTNSSALQGIQRLSGKQ